MACKMEYSAFFVLISKCHRKGVTLGDTKKTASVTTNIGRIGVKTKHREGSVTL